MEQSESITELAGALAKAQSKTTVEEGYTLAQANAAIEQALTAQREWQRLLDERDAQLSDDDLLIEFETADGLDRVWDRSDWTDLDEVEF